ncbi:hypothetical protein BJX99DRAFT_249041 [Aspergillus californicus]
MQSSDQQQIVFFCHICGAPPTWRGLLADSTLQYLDPEEDDFDHREYRYMDFMPGQKDFGYDTRLLPPKDIRWLDTVRLVTNKIVDTVIDTETEELPLAPVPLLTPLALHIRMDNGEFYYRDNGDFLQCNIDGYLVHDTCFTMLQCVHQHQQATCPETQDLDMWRLWKWLELGLEDRNNDLVDWGFADAFGAGGRLYEGKRFDPDYQEWVPAKGRYPAGYSFTFRVKPAQASPQPHLYPGPNVNVLSLLPRELQISILELLPSSSVLNLFLASPNFRRCAEHLPSSFWKSRLFFDMPWCADIILSQIPQGNGIEKSGVQFNRLFRFLREFYTSPGQEADNENLEFKGLRNRRRIWTNFSRPMLLKLLLEQRGHEAQIMDITFKIAAGNDSGAD